MPRIARIIGTGYPHHVTQRGNNQQAVFWDNKDRMKYLYLLEKYSAECGCAVFAYCLMDNHVHILFVPDKEDALAKTMQKLSLTYTQFINRKYKRTGRLWSCRYYSTIIDAERYLRSVLRYIEQNPVRAKIATNAIDYPWSSAGVIASGKKSFLSSIQEKYAISREEHWNLLNQTQDKTEIETIRKSTMTGKPAGSEVFLENIAANFGVDLSPKHRGRPWKSSK